jgi:hypothetical protein
MSDDYHKTSRNERNYNLVLIDTIERSDAAGAIEPPSDDYQQTSGNEAYRILKDRVGLSSKAGTMEPPHKETVFVDNENLSWQSFTISKMKWLYAVCNENFFILAATLAILVALAAPSFGASDTNLPTLEVFIVVALIIPTQLFAYLFCWSFYNIPCLGFSLPDKIAGFFCSSHKTLALGLPLITTMFAGSSEVGAYTIPLLVYHPTMILFGGIFCPIFARMVDAEKQEKGTAEGEGDEGVGESKEVEQSLDDDVEMVGLEEVDPCI